MILTLYAILLFAQPDLIVNSHLDRSESYVGERVIYTIEVMYRIYPASGEITLNEPDFTSAGLRAYPVSKEPEVRYERRFDEEYRVDSFRYILFPRRPGLIRIPPAVVSLEGGRIVGNDLLLKVHPLPLGFTGAVGRWWMEAGLSSSRAFLGTRIGYEIRLTGDGDPNLISEPRISWPSGFDVRMIAEDRRISTDTSGLESEVTFRYSLIPQSAGELTVPPAEILAFDPLDGRIYTLRSDSIHLTVLGIPGLTFPRLKKPKRLGEDGRPFYAKTWFISLQILPLLPLLLALAKRGEPVRGWLAMRRFTGELSRIGDDPNGLVRAVRGYIEESFGFSISFRMEMRTALKETGLNDELIRDLDELLARCEMSMFSPEGRIDPEMKMEAARVIREITSHRIKRWLRRLMKVAVIFILPSAPASIDPYPIFREATTLYESGSYDEALDRYLLLVERYRDGRLYYDIGLTYLRMNDPAGAILWLERARGVMPRDDDIARALMYARALRRDRFDFSDDLSGPLYLLRKVRGSEIIGFSLISYWSLLLSLNLYLWMGWAGGRNLARIFGLLMAASLLTFGLRLAAGHEEGVIAVDSAEVKERPIETAPSLIELHAGSKVRIESQRPGWFKVSTPTGEKGWIRREDVIPLDQEGLWNDMERT